MQQAQIHRYVQHLPVINSPPTATPCVSLSRTSSKVDIHPIEWYVGMHPIIKDGNSIRRTLDISASFLDFTSPKNPYNKPPIGRATNAAPKTQNDSNNAVVAFVSGKKLAANISASEPKIAKS